MNKTTTAPEGSEGWNREIAEAASAAALSLATASADEIDDRLHDVLRAALAEFGLVACGECAASPVDAAMAFDPDEITPGEIVALSARFRALGPLDGPASTLTESGRRALLIPDPSTDALGVFMALTDDPEGVGVDSCRLLELLVASLAGVRTRIANERDRSDLQEFIAELSDRAATDAPDEATLQSLLEAARDRLGVATVSTLVREPGHVRLVATTDFLGSVRLEPGYTVRADFAQVTALEEVGHLIRGFGDARLTDARSSSFGQVLVVPRFGPEGVEGTVVFADPEAHEWSADTVQAAKSVASSVQKLTVRTEAARDAARLERSRLIADIALRAARTTVEDLETTVHESLAAVIDHFEIKGAALWSYGDGRVTRRIGRWRDGRVTMAPTSVSITDEQREGLLERGHLFVDVVALEPSEELVDHGEKALVVPVGPELDGVVVLADPHRWWTDEDITAVQTLATLVYQSKTRLEAEEAVRERLRLEELNARTAATAVEITPDNADEMLVRILDDVVGFFGLAAASIWSFDGDRAVCVSAVRARGTPMLLGVEVPLPDVTPLVEQGWAMAQLPDLMPGDVTQLDPDETLLLVTGYGPPGVVAGALVFTDPTQRSWSSDHIAVARAVADVLGQVRARLSVARELGRQRVVERILADSSAAFVDATLEDAPTVVEACLEELRSHFGLQVVGLLELDHHRLQLNCPCEVVAPDFEPILRQVAPLPRDSATVARLLDPGASEQWRLDDIFGPSGHPDATALVYPAVRGRDILVLFAVCLDGGDFADDERLAFRSMSGLLAQLRRRLLLERQSARRSAADHLIGGIARALVDQHGEDHEAAIEDALTRVGVFFDAASCGRWDLTADGAVRGIGWSTGEHLDPRQTLDADDPFFETVDLSGGTIATEFGAAAPDASRRHDTLVVRPLFRGDELHSALVLRTPRPPYLVVDLEVQRETIESLGRLIEQLWRRAEAELAVARRLRAEDLLRQFATSLLEAGSDSADAVESALHQLSAAVGVDHGWVWRRSPDGDRVRTELAYEVALAGSREIRGEVEVVYGVRDGEPRPLLDRRISVFALEEAPPDLRRLVEAVTEPGPRQVAFFPEVDGNVDDEVRLLTVTRPGNAPFRPDECELFRSALSILAQHEARVMAERWFSAAFSSAPIGISMRDSELRLIECNDAYARFLGRPRDELIGQSLPEVLKPEPRRYGLEAFGPDMLRAVEDETAYVRGDGSIVWGSVRSTPVRVPGRRDNLVLTYVEDITERRRGRELLEYQATHDELTGLPNRRALVADIARELERSRRCAVLLLDLDRFKVVNDSLGHSVGDHLLVTCADRIRLSLRPGDSLCRLGGDEFAILLRAPTDAHEASVVAERLLVLLRDPVVISDNEIFPSASIGVALPENGDMVEDLLRHADAAMYQAKALGRNRWESFDSSIREAVAERIRTESDLRRAIDHAQLEVHYQPEFLLGSGAVVGVEALVRWRHPVHGLFNAAAFIDLAEETGLVVDIGRWVLAEATRQTADWVAAGHDIITRVNLSARQLRGAIVDEVEAALASASLASDHLCLELTETAIMDDVKESARILNKFRDLGVQIAIDDFGTGFSSLAYLKRFPVDILKIDRTFVDGVGVDADDTAIVSSIIGLAHTLRLEVVAEGVDDAAQVDELVRLGCPRGQGYHLARPAPAGDVSTLLAAGRPSVG